MTRACLAIFITKYVNINDVINWAMYYDMTGR